MKKSVFLLVMLFSAMALWSQNDIIDQPEQSAPIVTDASVLLLDGQTLSVALTKMNDSGIEYISDGKTLVLSADQLATVTLANGQVKTYQHYMSDNPTQNPQQLLPIIHADDGYYYMGDTRMTEAEYFSFIKNNCPEAWNSYLKGKKLWGLGLGFIIGGSVGVLAGSICMICSANYSSGSNSYNKSTLSAGAAITAVGCAFEIAGIPCAVVGGLKKYGSRRVYNNSCATTKETAVTFSLQSSPDGVGLAMKF